MSRLERTLNRPIVVLVVGVVAVALNVLLYFGYFLPRTAPLVEQKHQRSGDQRQNYGRDRQVIGHGVHGSRSRPSTWSVPVKPREASSTTRNRAVVAKLMTIAVRTSACGSGSA